MSANFYIDLVTALWLGFTGACIGSFLNVVAYRLPLGLSVVWKPSHCPMCGHPIRARDNVPVLGWLILRGKCRDCGVAIAPRYAIVEAILGSVFFILAYVELFSGAENLPGGPITGFTGAIDLVWNLHWAVFGVYLYHCLAVAILLAIALVDRDGHPIPVNLIVCGLVIGIAPPLLAEFILKDSLIFNPFVFPQPATFQSYFVELIAQNILAVAFCGLIVKISGISTTKISNLIVALLLAGQFLGADIRFRALYFAVFLLLFALSGLLKTKGKKQILTGIDSVWLALVLVLQVWPLIFIGMNL